MKDYFITFLLCVGAIALLALSTSCNIVASSLTGQPIPSSAVQRAGHDEAPIVNIASSDLVLAETGDPTAVYGLYDAGYFAKTVHDSFVDATK